MALRIHAQMVSNPVATTLLFFTCNFDEFVSSKLFVANSVGVATTFSLFVVPEDSDTPVAATSNALYGGVVVNASSTTLIPGGITMRRGDTMWINGAAALTFTLFGEGIGKEG